MLKNTENQKWIVFAFDATTGLAKTGDAAQITANLRKDYGDAAAITDTNPTELEDGFYAFDMSQAETNADHLLLCPASSTANIVVVGCPAVIFTEPTGRKYPASLAAADVSGNLPAEVKAQDNIDFGALQKASITAAVPTVDQIHDEVVEGTLTFRKILKILLAFAAGKSTGGGTATITFRDNADSKARITATADTDGNRTEVTLDGD